MQDHADATPTIAISTELAQPRVLSRDELRTLDRVAVDEMGVPSILLMENAAMGAARCIDRMLGVLEPGPVVVVAGPGNNGGDGLAVARQLHIRGHTVVVSLVGDEHGLTPDSAANLRAMRSCGLVLDEVSDPDGRVVGEHLSARLAARSAAVVVDGLLGTGLNRDVVGPASGAIGAINEARRAGRAACVVALDLPSGLDADTGLPLGDAVRADATLTFAALKTGFFSLEAQPYLGEIVLLPIGVPPGLTGRFGAAYEHEHISPTRFETGDTGGTDEPRGAGRDADGRR